MHPPSSSGDPAPDLPGGSPPPPDPAFELSWMAEAPQAPAVSLGEVVLAATPHLIVGALAFALGAGLVWGASLSD